MPTLDELMYSGMLSPEQMRELQTDHITSKSQAMSDVLRGEAAVEQSYQPSRGSGWGAALSQATRGYQGGKAEGRLQKAAAAQAAAEGGIAKQALLRKSGEKLRQEALAKEALAAQYAREDSKLVEENALKAKLLEEKNIYDEGQANLAGNRAQSEEGRDAIQALILEEEKQKGRMELAAAKDKDKAGPVMTPGQLSTALRYMGKEVKPVEDIVQAVGALDELMLPYYGQEDIPGIGRFEGQDNLLGKAARIVGPADGEKIHAARTRVLRGFVKEAGGLAQTLSEVQGVIQSYGAENLADEETWVKAYPEIKDALKADLTRIKASYLPEVQESFKRGYGGQPSPLDYEPRTLESQAQEAAGEGWFLSPDADLDKMNDEQLDAWEAANGG